MILVPYTKISAETEAALDAVGRPWTASWVGGDDTAYFGLLAERWARTEEFTVVEHDIAPTASALVSFDECSGDWCACPYPYFANGHYAGLGCTRFRAGVIGRNADLMDAVARLADEAHPPMHWCRLDWWISSTLSARGERRCENHPAVDHLHRWPSHDCFPRPT